MNINLKTCCALAGAALLCTSMTQPAVAQSHGGTARGGSSSGHANGAHVARSGRYDGGWQRGGPRWWGLGFGLGFGWDSAYYYGSPYAWSPGYYAQYDSPSPTYMLPGQVLPPVDYSARSDPSVTSNWYYCVSARSYYPYARKCPEAWQVVPAVPVGGTN